MNKRGDYYFKEQQCLLFRKGFCHTTRLTSKFIIQNIKPICCIEYLKLLNDKQRFMDIYIDIRNTTNDKAF